MRLDVEDEAESGKSALFAVIPGFEVKGELAHLVNGWRVTLALFSFGAGCQLVVGEEALGVILMAVSIEEIEDDIERCAVQVIQGDFCLHLWHLGVMR